MNYKNARPAHARWLIVLAVSTVALPNTSDAQNAAQERLEEIIVTSSIIAVPRRQLGTPISAIDNAEIELRGYTDLADVLRTQPGIGVSNSGGTGKQTTLRVRGEEGYRTLLMIDGVKALDASAPQVAPSFDSVLATNDLKRVEILRGPQGFIYGADAGGVVNVLTATGEGAFGGRLGLEYGDLATRKLTGSVSSGGERGDYFLSATDLQTDGFNAQTADTLLADEDGAENTTLHVKLGWNAAENLRLQLVARDIDAESMDDGCFSPTTFATVHDCVSATEQTTYKVSADYGGGAVTHAFGVSNVTIARENRNQGVNAFATDGEIGRFEYTGSYRSSDALTLVYGLDLQREEIVGGERLERDQRGYYAEYQGAFGSNFFLSLGARYDDNEDFGTHTSSRLSAAYVQSLGADGSLKYRASFGTGFRPPSLYETLLQQRPVRLSTGRRACADRGVESRLRHRRRVPRRCRTEFRSHLFRSEDRGRNLFRLDGLFGLPAVARRERIERARDRAARPARRTLGPLGQLDSQRHGRYEQRAAPAAAGNFGEHRLSVQRALRPPQARRELPAGA